MATDREERTSDSRLVRSVVRIEYDERLSELSVPDGSWDIVVFRAGRNAAVMITGTTTYAVPTVNNPGDVLLCISFKPGVYMPFYAPASMRNRAVMLPHHDRRSTMVASEVIEIPTFENADDFVATLERSGLFVYDDLVDSVVSGEPRAATPRTLQRHFLQSTGLTHNFYRQMERARRAVDLLRSGHAGAEAALEAGYADQSHMINSLKALTGLTPKHLPRDL